MTVEALAAQARVSPRLVSEFERGMRPNVSLETAMRLLQQVGVTLIAAPAAQDAAAARAARAAHRRATWVGRVTTLHEQAAPAAPTDGLARLGAVSRASRLAVGLRAAHERHQSTPPVAGVKVGGAKGRAKTGTSPSTR